MHLEAEYRDLRPNNNNNMEQQARSLMVVESEATEEVLPYTTLQNVEDTMPSKRLCLHKCPLVGSFFVLFGCFFLPTVGTSAL